MTDRKLSRALRGSEPPVDEGHRDRLEQQLLQAYDARVARRVPLRPTWVRAATVAAFVLCLVTATQVPAGYSVEVGKRITVTVLPGGAPPVPPERLAQTLASSSGRVLDMTAKVHRSMPGPTVLVVDVWGDALLPDGEAVQKLRALPELADAQVSVTSVKGRVRDNLLGLLEHTLLRADASPEEREQARRHVIEELRRREGEDARIDVQVDEEAGRQRVRIEVQKERRGPGPERPSASPASPHPGPLPAGEGE